MDVQAKTPPESPQFEKLSVEDSLELLAQTLQRHLRDVEQRIEGVRKDFEVALLQQVTLYDQRFERLEALVAEKAAPEVAESLLARLRQD